jgi:peroxisomal trans-2-enoyl-CoA reductase
MAFYISLQGIIFSQTAADNYKNFGSNLMGSQIPITPAKRLGTPEEVSTANWYS